MAVRMSSFRLLRVLTMNISIMDNIGDKLLMMTNEGAPKKKIVLVDPKNPGKENWKTIIPEKEEVLQGISLIGGKIVAEYMKDATSVAYIFDYEGTLLKI